MPRPWINSDEFGIILKIFSTFSGWIYTYSLIITEKPFSDATLATNWFQAYSWPEIIFSGLFYILCDNDESICFIVLFYS